MRSVAEGVGEGEEPPQRPNSSPHPPQFLRVRTVAGPTYYCRTGKSFKGHVKEKFLLVDCAVVMSGSYRCAQP